MKRVLFLCFLALNLYSEVYKYSIHDLAFRVSETNHINIIVDPAIDIEKNFFFYSPLDAKLSFSSFQLLVQNSQYRIDIIDNIYYVTAKENEPFMFSYVTVKRLTQEQLERVSKYFEVDALFAGSHKIVVKYKDVNKYREFKSYVELIDNPRHVYLEGEIIAVSESKLKDIGIDFTSVANQVVDTGHFDLGVFSNANFNDSVKQLVSAYSINNLGDISLFVNLLKQTGSAHVVTRPNMLIMSGETSTFKSGKQLRIISSSTDSVRAAGEYSSKQFEMLDIGLTLSCKAEVIDDHAVLNFKFAVKELDTYAPELEQLIIANKSYESRFDIKDGDTLALAGLTSDLDTEDVYAVPLLSSIPFVGGLFRHTTENHDTVSYIIYFKAVIK